MPNSKKCLSVVKFVDAYGKPIKDLDYLITDEDNYQVAKGKTNSKGMTFEISRDMGTVLHIKVKSIKTNEFKQIKQYFCTHSHMLVTVHSPKVMLHIDTTHREGSKGKYQRKPHKVKSGETLSEIAQKYGTTVRAMVQLNHIEDEDEIQAGQILKIPPKIPANGNHSASSTPPKSTHANANKSISHGSAHSNGNSHPANSHSSNTKPSTTATRNSAEGDDTWSWGNLQKQAEKGYTYLKQTANDGLNTAIVYKDKVEGHAEEVYHKMVNGGEDNSSNSGNSQPQDTKIPVNNGRSQENGTPKGVANSVCKTNPACITSGKSELIREVNIRLAGFGGALPTDEFTELTAKCIKQFQRDYMGVAETGKICGSLLVSLDKFREEYPLDKYATHLRCPCGKCDGFGNGRYNVPSGKSIANEYPGIHRSIAWILKTLQFYLTHEFKSKQLAVQLIFSGYRCIHDNELHSPPYTKKARKTVNHMGRALDIHFTKNGKHTGETPDMEYIRKNVMAVKMGAAEIRHPDKIYLEPSMYRHPGDGACSWVHYDVTQFTEEKYIRKEDFKKTIEEMNGKPLVELAKTFGNSNILGCSGVTTVMEQSKVLGSDVHTLVLTNQDVLDLKKVVSTEVYGWLKEDKLERQAGAVIDTILNRRMSKGYGKTIRAVINKPGQYSKINGPEFYTDVHHVKHFLHPYKRVELMPESAIVKNVASIVEVYLKKREAGQPSIIGGHLSYLNPKTSGRKAMEEWGNEVVAQGRYFDGHYHGTPKKEEYKMPKPFKIKLPF